MRMSDSSGVKVAVAYAVVCVVWGSTYLFIKLGVAVLPPYLLGGVRFSIAGTAFLAWCLATGRRLPRGAAEFGRLALAGVLFLVVGNGLLNTAERHLSSGLAALLLVTFPLWTTAFATIGHRGERMSPLGWAGLAVGLAGVALLVKPFERVESSWLGVALAMGAALSWAVGTVYAGRRLRGVDPLVASAVEVAVAGPLMLLVHALFEADAPIQWGGQAWLAVGYLALMGSIVGFTAFAYITAHMSSSKVGTYAYVNPIVAVLLGWLVLDEGVSPRMLVGGGVTLAGLWMVYRARVGRRRGTPRGA